MRATRAIEAEDRAVCASESDRASPLNMNEGPGHSEDGSSSAGKLDAFLKTEGKARGIAFLTALAVCSVVGAIGNVVAVCVFRTRLRRPVAQLAFRSNYNFFTMALAVADLAVCAIRIPYEVLLVLSVVNDDSLCRVTGFLSHAIVLFASLVHVGICVERYYAVCRPLRSLAARQVRLALGAIATASCILAVPAFFVYSIGNEQSSTSSFSSFSSSSSSSSSSSASILQPSFSSPSPPSLSSLSLVSSPSTSTTLSSVFSSLATPSSDFSPAPLSSTSLATVHERTGCHFHRDSGFSKSYSLTLGILMLAAVLGVLCVYAVIFRKIWRRVVKADGDPAAASMQGDSGDTIRRSMAEVARKWLANSTFTRKLNSSGKTAFMFFAVTLGFFISWVPYFLITLKLVPRDIFLEDVRFVTSATNFIFYFACNRRIRSDTVRKLSFQRKAKAAMLSSSLETSLIICSSQGPAQAVVTATEHQ